MKMVPYPDYSDANPKFALDAVRNGCCLGDALTAGSFDQRPVEARRDVLVYTGVPG